MGWCIEAICRRPGEHPREAITRAMAGGVEIRMTAEAPEMRSLARIDHRPAGVVSPRERQWMLGAAQALGRVHRAFSITAQKLEPGRRWPYRLTVESEDAPLWVSVDREAATLRPVRSYRYTENRDAEWRLWWRCVRCLSAIGCVVWDPDCDLIIATSMTLATARDRYGWL